MANNPNRVEVGSEMANNPDRVEVELVADFRDGRPGRPVYEKVPALRIGNNCFRLISSPGFAPGVAAGDEIELTDQDRLGYRVVKRSGNICVQLFLANSTLGERDEIVGMVKAIGGWLDGGLDGKAGHLLIFTIPLSTGFTAIERVMDAVSRKFSVDKWMYGNVYDVRDGVTPLNWWKQCP